MSEKPLRRVRALTWVLIGGLLVSGATAIPLQTEVDALVKITGAAQWQGNAAAPEWATWLLRVQTALKETADSSPFLFYGTDWLAFGHFAIAVAFAGALRNPVRNRWVFLFGMRVCLLLIPYALIFGSLRGIPLWWRSIDCLFGVLAFVPSWLCWKWTGTLAKGETEKTHSLQAQVTAP